MTLSPRASFQAQALFCGIRVTLQTYPYLPFLVICELEGCTSGRVGMLILRKVHAFTGQHSQPKSHGLRACAPLQRARTLVVQAKGDTDGPGGACRVPMGPHLLHCDSAVLWRCCGHATTLAAPAPYSCQLYGPRACALLQRGW